MQRNKPKKKVVRKVIKKEVCVGTDKIKSRQRKTQVCEADLGIINEKEKL